MFKNYHQLVNEDNIKAALHHSMVGKYEILLELKMFIFTLQLCKRIIKLLSQSKYTLFLFRFT